MCDILSESDILLLLNQIYIFLVALTEKFYVDLCELTRLFWTRSFRLPPLPFALAPHRLTRALPFHFCRWTDRMIASLLAIFAAFFTEKLEIMAAPRERTFIMVKPDGVHRGLVGEIIKRFEQRGYKLVGIKTMQVRLTLAHEWETALK